MDLLLKNKNLDKDLMNDVETIVSKILASPFVSYIDLENFSKNIEKLNIVMSTSLISKPTHYDNVTSTLYINPNLLEGMDAEFLLTKELIGLAASHAGDFNNGFSKFPGLLPLDDGIRDNLAEMLVGNISESSLNDDEKIIARLFEHAYGHELVMKSFFNANPETLINHMDKENGKDVTMQILNNMSNNYINRLNFNRSLLGEIEMQLTDVFMSKENLSDEELSDFERDLFTNSKVFGKHSEIYVSVDNADEYFKTKKEQIYSKQL